MKKLLGVLILGLLWCNISFAEDPKIKTYGGRSEIPEDAKPNDETLKYYLIPINIKFFRWIIITA